MLRLSLLLIGFVGWLLAGSTGGGDGLSLEYFYQNMFLSNGAEVVFEFKVAGCTPGTQLSGTIDFGDSQSQALTRINCERWRIPHTYYATASSAKLKLDGLPETSTLVDLNGPPETPPKLLTYQGGGSPGDGQPKGGNQRPPAQTTKTYQLILKNSGQGISGYVAVLGSPDSGFNIQNVKVTPVFLTKGFLFDGPGACSKAASGKCFSFRAELGDPEGCKNLQNKVMAEITVTGGAALVLDSIPTAVDAGPVCRDWVSDNKPIKDIAGNFELKQKTQ